MKNPSSNFAQRIFCDSDRIQTCNLLIRSQMLYSVEPRGRFIAESGFVFEPQAGIEPATFSLRVKRSTD